MTSNPYKPQRGRRLGGWGSSHHEQQLTLGGDEIVSSPQLETTHAITIHRSPDEVWPWLIQMGYGRAGWYTPTWVDRLWRVRNPSSDRLIPEHQHLHTGNQILDGPPGTATFSVEVVEPSAALVLYSERHPLTGRPPDRTQRKPGPYLSFSWGFYLESVAAGTRLLLRTRSNAYPRYLRYIAQMLFLPADILMGRWMLKGIKRRAESGSLNREKMTTARRATLQAASFARSNPIYALFECDVTKSTQMVEEHPLSDGGKLSFTAFLSHAIAMAVAERPPANSVVDIRGRVVTFDEVDVLVMVEVEIDGAPVPIGRVIRAANYKSVEQIHSEIRAAQADPLTGSTGRFLRWARWTPPPVKRAATRVINRTPRLAKRYKGTICVTSVGMFSEGGGWGIPSLHHTVNVTVGGTEARPDSASPGGERQCLSITLGVDHDVLDGAPAARLSERVKFHIEAGTGLSAVG